MKITDIIKERLALEKELDDITKQYRNNKERLESRIAELKEKESFISRGLDVEKIELGRKVLFIKGNPYATNDDARIFEETIAIHAIKDLVSGCEHLRHSYFGNKQYYAFYQRSDHEYGFGPSHGVIVDEVGLRNRDRLPTEEEIEAAVYYLTVFPEINPKRK